MLDNRLCKEISKKNKILESRISKLQQAGKELEERNEFEMLLSTLSTKFISLPVNKFDDEVEQALKSIAEALKVDRCTVFEFSADRSQLVATYSYTVEGFNKAPRYIKTDQIPWAANKVNTGETVLISNINNLAYVDEEEIKYFKSGGRKSLVEIPLMAGGNVMGMIAIISLTEEKFWSDDLIKRFRLIGEIFANALVRKNYEESLNKAYSKIKQLKEQIKSDYIYLQEEIKLEHNFDNIIGQSKQLKAVLLKVEQVAKTESTVLIHGETGTGKELIARAIHNASHQNERPLVKVDCAALPKNLIERELFGHEKGAFTGAEKTQIGRFELANDATIFLDEIGELPMELQAKLLRVLQDGEFERLGNPKTLRTNARVIAATNRNLEEEVRNGRFRKDLWFRLNIFPIIVPPLRLRKDDIPMLVQWFVHKYSTKMGKQIDSIHNKTMSALQNYNWPGNVRELQNLIERALITAQKKILQIELPEISASLFDSKKTLEEVEREYIIQVLEDTNWKISGPDSASMILKMNPSTLRSRLQKHNITKLISTKKQ